jgi:hypothetical protein
MLNDARIEFHIIDRFYVVRREQRPPPGRPSSWGTLGQAIDKTLADCAAQFKDTPCILYAVNNRVVFGSC